MSIESFANQHVLELVAYQPGKPIEETARELGLDPRDIVKLASNENPLDRPPGGGGHLPGGCRSKHLSGRRGFPAAFRHCGILRRGLWPDGGGHGQQRSD